MAVLPQLERISPSSADQLGNCPWAWHQQRVVKAMERPQSRPMIRGSVFHEALAGLLSAWAGGAETLAPDAAGAAMASAAAGRIPLSEIEDLTEALMRLCDHLPCTREQVLLVEPAQIGPAGYPEPTLQWQPVQADGWAFRAWGIPDLVFVDSDGRPCIWDWKTGRAPEDPSGFAPIIYTAQLLAHWEQLSSTPFTWPVRVGWQFVLFGRQRGVRERLIYPEDLDAGIAALEALVARAEDWHASGDWPCMVNHYCAWCPAVGQCAEWSQGSAERTAEELARDWVAAEQEEKFAAADKARIAEHLQGLAAAGTEFHYPDGKVLACEDAGKITWRIPTRESLIALLDLLAERDIDPVTSGILTISGTAMSQRRLKDDPAFAPYRTPDGRASVTFRRKAVA
ncbi:MAG TPA: PD-(D/E)XK nuclease family protein [Thermoanaerobaculales bacterium]|nr:PD-(D/E)XK nuclease family protein [Thermoanaerobaculales bacterium]